MVEAGSLEVAEDTVADALPSATSRSSKIVAAIRELHAKIQPKKVYRHPAAF